MNRDLRDPTALGRRLFDLTYQRGLGEPLSSVYDKAADYLYGTRVYDANPSCIEKYGRPQDLPSTLPN